MYKKCFVCFIVDTGPKSYQSSKHGTDIQTEAAAQMPSEIQLTDIPKPEQRQHYGFDNQGNAYTQPHTHTHTFKGIVHQKFKSPNSIFLDLTHERLRRKKAHEL